MRHSRLGLALFCIILLFISTFSFALNPVETKSKIAGDINEDGELNVIDLVQILIAIKYGLGSERILELANLDRSPEGNISTTDMLVMLDLINGKAPLEFYDFALSNLTGTAFVVSWRTNRTVSSSQVRYGYARGDLSQVAEESYGENSPENIHFIQVVGLRVDTTVYYKIVSDHVEYSAGAGGVDSVSTFPQAMPPFFVNLQGTVTDGSDNPRERVLVRSFLKNPGASGADADTSMWFAALTREDGTFPLDAANFRTTDGKVMNYIQEETWIHLRLIGNRGETLQDSVLLTARPYTYQLLGTFVLDSE